MEAGLSQIQSHLLLNIKYIIHSCTIKHMAIDGKVCFHRQLFVYTVKPLSCTTGCVEKVNGINKDMSHSRLLPPTVSSHPVDLVCFCQLLKTQHCFL